MTCKRVHVEVTQLGLYCFDRRMTRVTIHTLGVKEGAKRGLVSADMVETSFTN